MLSYYTTTVNSTANDKYVSEVYQNFFINCLGISAIFTHNPL